MEGCSRETRIELTPLGCSYVANRRLGRKSNFQSEAPAGDSTKQAEASICAALKGMGVHHQPATPL
jgi:hypothetical protein